MNRILKDNPNTKEHWTEIYNQSQYNITENMYLRYGLMALNMVNLPIDLVDLGCGTGACDIVISDKRPLARITGVDLAPQGTTLPIFCQFIQGEVTDTGLPDASFDYALSCEVLEHLDEPQKLIDEMYRLLRPGGKAMLTTPYLNRLPSGEHVWEFDTKDVEEMFFKAGFSKAWAFPWSSDGQVADETGQIIQPQGTWDEIFTFAEK